MVFKDYKKKPVCWLNIQLHQRIWFSFLLLGFAPRLCWIWSLLPSGRQSEACTWFSNLVRIQSINQDQSIYNEVSNLVTINEGTTNQPGLILSISIQWCFKSGYNQWGYNHSPRIDTIVYKENTKSKKWIRIWSWMQPMTKVTHRPSLKQVLFKFLVSIKHYAMYLTFTWLKTYLWKTKNGMINLTLLASTTPRDAHW